MRLAVFAASGKDGSGQTLHRRLFVVEAGDEGMTLRKPTVFLDVVPAIRAEPPDGAVPSRGEAEAFLLEQALEPFLDEVRAEREREVETIARHVELALTSLIDRQQIQVDELFQRQQRGVDVSLALQEAERRLDDLNDRLERRREELARQRQFALSDVSHLGSAWVLPHPERTGHLAAMVMDPEIERIAIRAAMHYEREHGRDPVSVEAENRGFDILSTDPVTGLPRFIEVKGRAGTESIALTANEYRTAERLGDDYWLYAVFDCRSDPRLLAVQNPARLGWEPITVIEHYLTTAEQVEQAADRG